MATTSLSTERRRTLRVLVVEDSRDDYEIVVWHLRRLDFHIQAMRVETAQAMRDALTREGWDLVVSDWSLPAFSAPAALEIFRRSQLDVPFIIVSGTVGEETAVEALRNGAHDFLVKHRLARLGAIVQRELHDAEVRRERARLDEEQAIADSMATVRILTGGVAAALEEVRDAPEHVRTIAHDLRVFAQSDQQRGRRVDVTRVLESTLRIASNEISQRARLTTDYQAVPPVVASEAQLGQVFFNLVINALRALPETDAAANELRVAVAFTSGCVCVDIADNGPGIAPAGLGFSLSQRIVTALGGEIRVAPQPSAGRFTVLLPPAP